MTTNPGARRRRTSRLPRRAPAAGFAVALLATVAVLGWGPAATVSPTTTDFRGANWADPRDNYADDPVVLSGLSVSDSYDTVYAKATAVIRGFRANLGANTVRLPINPYTVNGPFWAAYTGAIDAATANGFKVILSYWEGVVNKDGTIDDEAAFWAMWETVTSRYARNHLVYFEPMNEPFGYLDSDWVDLAVQWIGAHPTIPRNRIFVSGTGYNDDVTGVCEERRLAGTFLSLHHYGFWNPEMSSYDSWVTDLRNRIGSCAARTVLDEWGAPMTTGFDYNGPIGDNNFVAYVQADTDTLRSLGIGSIYWPGLRTGDSYSMQTLVGAGTDLTLADTNASGVSRLRRAWGLAGAAPTRSSAPPGG